MNSPIALFVYNRFDHTKKTIEALSKNFLADKSDLFIFSDAAKNDKDKKTVQEIRAYLKGISGFQSVHVVEKQNNDGLAKSIIGG